MLWSGPSRGVSACASGRQLSACSFVSAGCWRCDNQTCISGKLASGIEQFGEVGFGPRLFIGIRENGQVYFPALIDIDRGITAKVGVFRVTDTRHLALQNIHSDLH